MKYVVRLPAQVVGGRQNPFLESQGEGSAQKNDIIGSSLSEAVFFQMNELKANNRLQCQLSWNLESGAGDGTGPGTQSGWIHVRWRFRSDNTYIMSAS